MHTTTPAEITERIADLWLAMRIADLWLVIRNTMNEKNRVSAAVMIARIDGDEQLAHDLYAALLDLRADVKRFRAELAELKKAVRA